MNNNPAPAAKLAAVQNTTDATVTDLVDTALAEALASRLPAETPGITSSHRAAVIAAAARYAASRGWSAAGALDAGAHIASPEEIDALLRDHSYHFGQPDHTTTKQLLRIRGCLVIPQESIRSDGSTVELPPQLRIILGAEEVDNDRDGVHEPIQADEEKKLRRFASAAGVRNVERVFAPTRTALTDPTKPLIVIEGMSKAIALWSALRSIADHTDYAFLVILGCAMGATTREPGVVGPVPGGVLAKHPEMLEGRQTYTLLDGDFATNPAVASELDKLSTLLGSKADSVSSIIVPEGASVDDHLGKFPVEGRYYEARRLIGSATHWDRHRPKIKSLPHKVPTAAEVWRPSGFDTQVQVLVDVLEEHVADPAATHAVGRDGSLARPTLMADGKAVAHLSFDSIGIIGAQVLPDGVALFQRAGLVTRGDRWSLARQVLDAVLDVEARLEAAAEGGDEDSFARRSPTLRDIGDYLTKGGEFAYSEAADALRGVTVDDGDEFGEHVSIARSVMAAVDFLEVEGDTLAERIIASREDRVTILDNGTSRVEYQVRRQGNVESGLYETTSRISPSGTAVTTSTLMCEHIQVPLNARSEIVIARDGTIDREAKRATAADEMVDVMVAINGRRRVLKNRLPLKSAFSTSAVALEAVAENVRVYKIADRRHAELAETAFQRLRFGGKSKRAADRMGYLAERGRDLRYVLSSGALFEDKGHFAIDGSVFVQPDRVDAVIRDGFAMVADQLVGQAIDDSDAEEFIHDALTILPTKPGIIASLLGAIFGAPSAGGQRKFGITVVAPQSTGKTGMLSAVFQSTLGLLDEDAKYIDLSKGSENSLAGARNSREALGEIVAFADDLKRVVKASGRNEDPSEAIAMSILREAYGSRAGVKATGTKKLAQNPVAMGWPIISAEVAVIDRSTDTRSYVARLEEGDIDFQALNRFQEKWEKRGPRLYWSSVLIRARGVQRSSELHREYKRRKAAELVAIKWGRIDEAAASFVAGLSFAADEPSESLRNLFGQLAADISHAVKVEGAKEQLLSDSGHLILEQIAAGLQKDFFLDVERVDPDRVVGAPPSGNVHLLSVWSENIRRACGYRRHTSNDGGVQFVENRTRVGMVTPDGKTLLLTHEGLKAAANAAGQGEMDMGTLWTRLKPYVIPGTPVNSKPPSSVMGRQDRVDRITTKVACIDLEKVGVDLSNLGPTDARPHQAV